jgi:hypothetical protein
VREAARVLRSAGTFVVSTPQVARTTRTPANPHHRVEFARSDFERLLRASFSSVELYGEHRVQTRRHEMLRRLDVLGLRRRFALLRRASALTGTRATEDVTLEDVVISQERIESARVLVAVCA